MKRTSLHALAVATALLSWTAMPCAEAPAAVGDVIHETFFDTPCPLGFYPPTIGPIGVGIAFDGKYLWYSCSDTKDSDDLYKVDPITGKVVASYYVQGGLGALAWDGKRKVLWAGWTENPYLAKGSILQIDPDIGLSTPMFNAAEAATESIDDGLAYSAAGTSCW